MICPDCGRLKHPGSECGPSDRETYEQAAINCGKIKTDVLELMERIERVRGMTPVASDLLGTLHGILGDALHDSMNAGLDHVETVLKDFDADDEARYQADVRSDYLASVR